MLETMGDILLNYFSIGIKDRKLQWLTSLALAQLLLVLVVFWPAGSKEAGELLFSDRTTEDIIELQLVNVDGERMNLAKQGDDWAMSDADNFPVSVEKVDPLITKLLALKTDRIVATTDNSHIRLEVSSEKYKRKIDIVWADDTINTLLLGNSAGTGAMQAHRLIRMCGRLATAVVAFSGRFVGQPSRVRAVCQPRLGRHREPLREPRQQLRFSYFQDAAVKRQLTSCVFTSLLLGVWGEAPRVYKGAREVRDCTQPAMPGALKLPYFWPVFVLILTFRDKIPESRVRFRSFQGPVQNTWGIS